jgi:hypothetical protein
VRTWVAALTAAGLAACTSKPAPPTLRTGIHVPLPEGWTSTFSSERSLRAGPKGRWILRVEARASPDPSHPLPAPLALAEEFSKDAPALRATVVSEVAEKDFSMVMLEVSKQGSRARAMLGARRIGRELFLCGSEPGSSEEEVSEAAEACRGLSEGGGDP